MPPPPSSITKKPVGGTSSQPTTRPADTTTDDEPPAYTDPPSPAVAGPSSAAAPPALPPRRGRIPGLPNIPFWKYALGSCEASADASAHTTSVAALSTSAAALVDFANEQLALPPWPCLVVQGDDPMRVAGGEFLLKINMMRYLLPQDGPSWSFVRLVSDGELAFRGGAAPALKPVVAGGLREWAARFCREQGGVKTFLIQREVINWNVEYLEGQIRSLVAATGYRGHVSVSVVMRHSQVVVQTPVKVNKFWNSIVSTFQEAKKYEVVKAVWPYATMAPGNIGRKCAVQSEEAWWHDWKDVIWLAVVNKKKGWLTLDDLMEYEMNPKNGAESAKNWVSSPLQVGTTGSSFVGGMD